MPAGAEILSPRCPKMAIFGLDLGVGHTSPRPEVCPIHSANPVRPNKDKFGVFSTTSCLKMANGRIQAAWS